MFATDLKVAEAGLASSADALLESQEQCKGLTKRLAVAQEDSRTLSIGLEMQREASAAAAKDFEAKSDASRPPAASPPPKIAMPMF